VEHVHRLARGHRIIGAGRQGSLGDVHQLAETERQILFHGPFGVLGRLGQQVRLDEADADALTSEATKAYRDKVAPSDVQAG